MPSAERISKTGVSKTAHGLPYWQETGGNCDRLILASKHRVSFFHGD
jgi:hypothetical protein